MLLRIPLSTLQLMSVMCHLLDSVVYLYMKTPLMMRTTHHHSERRHMVDSDSDSNSPLSMTCRQLARRYGWYESSSNSSDDSSVPSLDYDSEDSIEVATRYLIPVAGGTPLHPKSTWFLEDEISYHETSSVSSSASSHTSSSNSDDSSRSGQGPFPFEFVDLLHLSVFDDQMQNRRLNSCLTWEPTAAPPLPWIYDIGEDQTNQHLAERAQQRAHCDKHYLPPSRCKIEDLEFNFRPCYNKNDEDAEMSEPKPTTPDTVSSLIFSTHGSNALRRWSEPYDRSSPFPPCVMPSSDTNENLSSSSEVMLPSTSDAGSDVDYTSNFSVTSNHLWTTQDTWPDQISQTMISDGPPRFMHAWTPRMMMTGRSRVRYLAGHNNNPTDVCTQLFHDVSDIRRSISCPPSWNRIILNYAVSQANHRPTQANHGSPIPSNEVVQHRNISPVTDNAINPVQYESNRGETGQTDTNNEHLSHALTLRPSMDTQFATLIDIIR